jgi:hypothetical protein
MIKGEIIIRIKRAMLINIGHENGAWWTIRVVGGNFR